MHVLHVKYGKNKIGPFLFSRIKISSKWVKVLNVRTKTIKPSEENFNDQKFGSDSVEYIPKE